MRHADTLLTSDCSNKQQLKRNHRKPIKVLCAHTTSRKTSFSSSYSLESSKSMDQPIVKPLKVKNVQNFRSRKTTAEANKEICQHTYEWGERVADSLCLLCVHTHTWGFEDHVKGFKTERKEKWWEHTKIIHEICNQTPHFGIAIQVWALKNRGSYISMVLWGNHEDINCK